MSAVDVEAPAREDTPLVTTAQESGDVEQAGLEPDQLKPIKEGSMRETLVGVLAGITVVASIFAVVVNHGVLVIISSVFGVALGPFAAFQQTKLTQAIAMKETNAYFQKQLDILKALNEKLSGQVKEMTQSIDNLEDMEKTLGKVQTIRGDCLQQLEEQLKKQRDIAEMTKTTVKNDIIGNMMEIALNCDLDGDMKMSDKEVDMVIKKMESINGVDIREEKVRAIIAEKGRDIVSLMEIAKKFLQDDIPEEDKLFIYV